MSTNFLILKNILAELKRKNSITVLEEYYQDKWEFHDLLMDLTNDENFKQAYIDNSFSKSFKKDFDHYTELANQAKKAVSKYFRDKDIDLRAFYVETNNSDKVLNINLINYNRSEPIRISDILQQERDISTLNIYCDKKHDIYAYRKDKERHYEFKEGAYYEMTSTWPVQDKDGKTVTCTMVMNVSNSGITKVLQFNGKDFESPTEEFWNLIRQNEELYIQGLSLHNAVKALLEKNKDAPAVINLQNNEHIVINKDEKMKDLENDAKSNPILSFTSNNVSEVNPQQIATQAIATQTEVNSQHTETQIEVAVQHVETQAEISSQETETQTKVNLQEAAIQTEIAVQHIETQTEIASQQARAQNLQEVATQIEVNLQHIETQTEVTVQHTETQTGIGSQETETQTEVNLQEAAVQTEVNSQQLDQNLTKAEQEIRELNELRNNLQYRLEDAERKFEGLEKHNSDLQNELGEEKQKNAKLQTELTQKDEKLTNISTELQERAQELEGAYEEKKDLKKKLEIANAGKEELISELRKLHEELDQLLSNCIIKQKKLEQELMEAKQKNVELEKHNSDLQDRLEEKEQKNAKLQAELTQKNEELANMSTELQEFEKANKKLKKNLEIANVELEKLEDELKQLKEREEEAEHMISEKWKDIANLKSKMGRLDDEHSKNLESHKQEVDKLKQRCEWLQDELELKDEQIKRQGEQLQQKIKDEHLTNLKSQMQNLQSEHNAHLEPDEQEECELEWDHVNLSLETEDEQIETIRAQLWQEIEEEIVNKYHILLEPQFKEYENEIEILKEKIKDQAMEIERITEEREKLNGREQYLNSQKEVFDNNSKTSNQLTEKIDDSEKKSRSLSLDSAFHSDHCNCTRHNLI
ncbi:MULTISPECIES: hypothetical protein [Wolbachia]|nr:MULTISPECIES: hypothetical protein [Wolbachia]UYC24063.1 hypothetical protein L3551_02275 [Wolbachia endosymbiont of Aedes aegypti]QBB84122.1 hypothetical protein DEJ70_05155 [Wolbachia pipientis wAlbB]QDW08921.1 hypothetical protein CO539_005130 [Wolbachia pipientis]QDW10117.1 hypothetical protein CO538_005135 [Wolbachia pipientis]QZA83190.1 hypothetical protein K1Y75_05015 [Wolbachia pipientis]